MYIHWTHPLSLLSRHVTHGMTLLRNMIWTVPVFGENNCNSAYSVRAKLYSIETESQVNFLIFIMCFVVFLFHLQVQNHSLRTLQKVIKCQSRNNTSKGKSRTPFKIYLYKFLCFLSFIIITYSAKTANPGYMKRYKPAVCLILYIDKKGLCHGIDFKSFDKNSQN